MKKWSGVNYKFLGDTMQFVLILFLLWVNIELSKLFRVTKQHAKILAMLLNPVDKVEPVLANTKSVLFVKLPTIRTLAVFCKTLFTILSTVANSIELNTEVFIAFVVGHSCTLIHCQLHIRPDDLSSKISVVIGQGSIDTIVKTTNWLDVRQGLYKM